MYIQNGGLVTTLKGKAFRRITSFFTSMRFLLFVLFMLCAIVPSVVMRQSIIGSYQRRAVTVRTADVQSQCTILANQITSSGYFENPGSDITNTQIDLLADVYAGRILIVDGSLEIVRDTFALDEGKTIVSAEAIGALRGQSSTSFNKREGYIEVSVPVFASDGKTSEGAVIAAVSTTYIEDSLEVLRDHSMVFLSSIIFAMAVIGLFFAFAFEQPVRRVRRAIQNMAEGYDDTIPDVRTYSELRRILDAYNRSVSRMKLLDESRSEFVSNVSHELKTPITSMKVLADSLLSQENVPEELYREFMQDIAREIDRESNIIGDLLALVRLDDKDAIEVSNVNINDLVEHILKRLRPIASQRNIELVLESYRPVIAEIDETRLGSALTNLIENAIKYNKEGGWVHVLVNADYKYFYVRVEDSGIGIPEEDQENVFERFYRVDKSHSKEISGTGLGLSIAKSIVLKHRGTIHLYSKEGEGTTFNVRIPLTYTENL